MSEAFGKQNNIDRSKRERRELPWKPDVQDGIMAQAQILGLRKIKAVPKPPYLERKAAFEDAELQQPGIGERSRDIINLRTLVAQRCDDKNTIVKFVTALGTSLDYHHGIDGYLKQGDKIATIDVSTRVKEGEIKADVLIVLDKDEKDKAYISETEMEHAATAIARKLNELKAKR